jgi:autotransporter-associated beta strand protein
VATSQLISSNLIIGTIGGSYTLENDATNSSATVQFEGTIEGTNQASGSPTAATLYLSGSNNGSNIFDGPLSNNGVEKLNLVKIGGGSWTVYGQDTYTGTTVVSAGNLSLPFNFTATGAITVNGGLLQLTGDITKASVTVGINSQMQISGSSQ